MALFRKTDRPVSLEIGQDGGKPVLVKVRAIPAAEDREIRRSIYGDIKSRKVANQSFATYSERNAEYERARAVRALIDTENFSLLLEGEALDTYRSLLGEGRTPEDGKEVLLDGLWSEALKQQFFLDFPMFASTISARADSITQAELSEDKEATQGF